MPSYKPKSPKAGTRRTSDTKTLRQGSEEVAGVHRVREIQKEKGRTSSKRGKLRRIEPASQENAKSGHLRAEPFATMIREVSR